MKALNFITTLTLLFLSVAVVRSADNVQKPMSDAEITRKLIGVWLVDVQSADGSSSLKGTITMDKTGGMIAVNKITGKNRNVEVQYSGTWQVKDGILLENVMVTSNPVLLPVPTVYREKIIRLNEDELVYEKLNGTLASRKRQKKNP